MLVSWLKESFFPALLQAENDILRQGDAPSTPQPRSIPRGPCWWPPCPLCHPLSLQCHQTIPCTSCSERSPVHSLPSCCPDHTPLTGAELAPGPGEGSGRAQLRPAGAAPAQQKVHKDKNSLGPGKEVGIFVEHEHLSCSLSSL